MSPQFSSAGVQLFLGDCREVMPAVSGIHSVIADPPFGERTHAGHDCVAKRGRDGAKRQQLGYEPWGDTEVQSVCALLPREGWVCILTDHVLGRIWEHGMRELGRYVFAPVPLVIKGRSVRLTGDGPSSWTDWLIPSRTKAELRWGTLPGLYEGRSSGIEHMGGKPLNAMCRIVEDYSRKGSTVLDFCMGAGTTAIACIRTGRNFVGIEKDPETFEKARARIERELSQGRLAI